jgi:serine/threonine protein kinase
MIKKLGSYTMSSYLISDGKYSKVYQGVDSKGGLVAIKEVKITEFSIKKLSKSSDLVQDFLKCENKYVVRLIDIIEQGLFVYFIEELSMINLAKEVKKYEVRSMSEMLALLTFSQILNGYKFFFKKGLLYRHLNPRNVLKIDQKYKLSIPTTILQVNEEKQADELGTNEDDYLYYSPEQLIGEKVIDHKSDIWALGCILYFMLYTNNPWSDFSLPKKYIVLKDPQKTLQYRNFGLYQFIKINGVRFPQPNPVNSTLQDLIKRMLEFDATKRISLQEVLDHPFLEYLVLLNKNHSEGSFVDLRKSKITPSTFTANNLTKYISEYEKSQIRSELKTNFKNRNQKLSIMQKEAPQEFKISNSFIPDPEMKMDEQSIKDLEKICSEIDVKSKSNETPLRASVLTPFDIQQNDKIIEELEMALNKSDGILEEDPNSPNMSIDQLSNFINSLKKRIILKITAFDEIKIVVNSAYIFAFRFFLLKSSLYDMIKLEKKLIQDENPFKSVYWEEFKKKPVFAKIVNSIFKQEDRIMDMIDEYLPKAVVVLKNSNIKFNESFVSYLNKDPYQDISMVLTLLMENLLSGHLIPRIQSTAEAEKKIKLMKFAILVRLILMIEKYGKFTEIDPMLEFASSWQETEASSDPKFIEGKFMDLVLNN